MATNVGLRPVTSLRFTPDDARPRLSLSGSLNGSLAAKLHDDVWSLIGPGRVVVVDFAGVTDISSLGLRALLLFARHVRAAGSVIEMEGSHQSLLDMFDAVGFSRLLVRPTAGHPLSAAPPSLMPIDAYPTHFHRGIAFRCGFPLPLGATLVPRGVNFSIYSRHATGCTLSLFEAGTWQPLAEIPFPRGFRLGDVFAMTVFDLDLENVCYGYRLEGPNEPSAGHRFDSQRFLLDPTARALMGRAVWGEEPETGQVAPFLARLVPQDFDWEGDTPLELPLQDLVIYELHVRGMTRSPSSGVKFPGTFAGLREKIPYLKALGVNAVELMPVFEFDELENKRVNPMTGQPLYNYWGYSPVAFYAPNSSYAASGKLGLQADEFKAMVKEFHAAGIEVILDVVFNHTAEGNEHGPTISWRGIDNKTYYLLTPDGRYYNFSGCGNTLNCNHPVVRDMVVDCLRHWVAEYHVDGFRFDLASILGRDQQGVPLANPPLLEALAADPVLGRSKLIAEAWDAAGLYQVGEFPAYARWAEWNGKYRDSLRRFLRGDFGMINEVATRLLGSEDLYAERSPAHSVNFITCHDGFTLHDLFSYNAKHNEANGEQNTDGTDENYSSNCGIEGPTDDPRIAALRRRQAKNALTMLLISQGVPMFLMGDECGRSQQGNNNAYCHDSPLNWFDWTLPASNAELWRYTQQMIQFRRLHPALRHSAFVGHADSRGGTLQVTWHGTRAYAPDWSAGSRVLAFSLLHSDGHGPLDEIYVVLNMHTDGLLFELPRIAEGRCWHVFADTSRPAPDDIAEPGDEAELADQQSIYAAGRSVLILVAR